MPLNNTKVSSTHFTQSTISLIEDINFGPYTFKMNISATTGPEGISIAKPSAWQYNLPLNWNWTFSVHRYSICLNCIRGMDMCCECWLIISIVFFKGIMANSEDILNETISLFDIFIFSIIANSNVSLKLYTANFL